MSSNQESQMSREEKIEEITKMINRLPLDKLYECSQIVLQNVVLKDLGIGLTYELLEGEEIICADCNKMIEGKYVDHLNINYCVSCYKKWMTYWYCECCSKK